MRYVAEQDRSRYQLVVNSAMFEHVLDRAALDEVNAPVRDDGVLMLHMVIAERVPRDLNWFYINTMIHSAFHTNRSMSLLMDQWGYAASIHSPQAKSWYLFKRAHPLLGELEARRDDQSRIADHLFPPQARVRRLLEGFSILGPALPTRRRLRAFRAPCAPRERFRGGPYRHEPAFPSAIRATSNSLPNIPIAPFNDRQLTNAIAASRHENWRTPPRSVAGMADLVQNALIGKRNISGEISRNQMCAAPYFLCVGMPILHSFKSFRRLKITI